MALINIYMKRYKATVNAGLDEDTFSYLDWELDDVKELNDFETIEVIQLS